MDDEAEIALQRHAYGTWVWHNFLAQEIHALTPARGGFWTFGDAQDYYNDEETNSFAISAYGGGRIAHRMGLLAMFGLPKAAAIARWWVRTLYSRSHHQFSWPFLMFDRAELGEKEHTDLPLAYLDSGLGIYYDRTDWSEDASYFVFHAGWTGIDHSHEETGAFQLYRGRSWVTHESLAYQGPGGRALGHSVLMLETGRGLGQYAHGSTDQIEMLRASSSPQHAFVAAETTGAYVSHEYRSHRYEAVQRQIMWLKGGADEADRVVVYDLVDDAESGGERRWQLHLPATPRVSGRTATATSGGQRVDVTAVLPANTQLSASGPSGAPNRYPGEVYTSRVFADPGRARNLRMVMVVRAADASAPEEATAAIESDEVVGTRTGNDVVVFAREALPGGSSMERAMGSLFVRSAPSRVLSSNL